jgi:hypothetical protein
MHASAIPTTLKFYLREKMFNQMKSRPSLKKNYVPLTN